MPHKSYVIAKRFNDVNHYLSRGGKFLPDKNSVIEFVYPPILHLDSYLPSEKRELFVIRGLGSDEEEIIMSPELINLDKVREIINTKPVEKTENGKQFVNY